MKFEHDEEFYRQEARAIGEEYAEHNAWKRRTGYGQRKGTDTSTGQTSTSHTPTVAAPSTAVITNMVDVMAQPIRWHWPLRLASGKVSLVVGDPGVGKSAMWMDLVARTSTGCTWPDGHAVPQGGSVILSAEDALDDTIKPRLHAAGADMSCICAIESVLDPNLTDRLVTLDRDIAALEAVIRERKARLFVIDPLGAYLPAKLDAKSDHQVRAVLRPLMAMAGRTDAVGIVVMHLTKDANRKVLHRVLGSIGFVASARFALAVADDPDHPERRLLLPVKQNSGPPAATLAFRLDPCTVDTPTGRCETVRLAWESGPVDGVTADQVFRAGAEDRTDSIDAEQLIADLLEDGTEWPMDAKAAIEAGQAHGIPERTLRCAARRAGIGVRKLGFGVKGRWQWHRPAAPTP